MILLHPKTLATINDVLTGNHHAIGISASSGSGKSTVALHVVEQLVNDTLVEGGNYFHLKPTEKSVIEIEQIRGLLSKIKLKTTSNYPRRVIFVEDAHHMTNESQNALLKAIEEAKPETIYVFTFNHKSNILPTIMSRISHIQLLPPSEQDIKKHFSGTFNEQEINKAYLMSGGRIGLMDSILRQDDHKLTATISEAKNVLSGQTYDRLCMLNRVSHNSADLIEGLLVLTSSLLDSSITNQSSNMERIIKLRKSLFHAKRWLTSNPNQKLLLTDLFLKM